MSLRVKLYLYMLLFAAGTILIGTAILYGLASLLGLNVGLYAIIGIVVVISILQWLFSPSIIEAVYRVRPADPALHGDIIKMVEDLARRSGIKPPKVGIAYVPIPNAFAYGSPIKGNRIAVTKTLLEILDRDELAAVIGHELGHLKHRDVTWMLAISLLPMIIYYLGQLLYYSGIFGTFGGNRNAGSLFLLGIALLAVGFVLNLFVLAFSRFREYYADRHAVSLVRNGGRALQRALVKIVAYSREVFARYGVSAEKFEFAKALFIQDPDAALKVRGRRDIDEMIRSLMREQVRPEEKLAEVLSTHPNLKKRLKALEQFNAEFWGE